MSTHKLTQALRDETVRQVVERGYRVPDVPISLGVSAHSLCKLVRAVSRVLRMARAGVYEWQHEPASDHARKNARPLNLLRYS